MLAYREALFRHTGIQERTRGGKEKEREENEKEKGKEDKEKEQSKKG